MITFRPAGPDDASFLAEMLREAVNWHPGRCMSMAQIMAEPRLAHYVTGWPRPGDGGVIVLADRQPIGAAWWRFFSEDDPGYGFVSVSVPELSMAVVAHWRGRGVGPALLRQAVAAAASHCRQLSLSVERANRAQKLYLSEGFRVVASGTDADTMLRDLDATTGSSVDDTTHR
jgi:GNAT superfamily N-acetyltransferase